MKQDDRFVSVDGELLRNAVYEAAMQMDVKLIKALFENTETKKRFFTDIDGIAVNGKPHEWYKKITAYAGGE